MPETKRPVDQIEIHDSGPSHKEHRYRARYYTMDSELGGMEGAETPAKARALLLDAALSIAAQNTLVVAFQDGGRAEVGAYGTGLFEVWQFAAGKANRGGGMSGSGPFKHYAEEAGRLAAFHGGIAEISISFHHLWDAIHAACERENKEQEEGKRLAAEYADAARYVAARGGTGVEGDALPDLLSAEVAGWIARDPKHFAGRVEHYAQVSAAANA
jgi:hypothetical protein